MPLTPQFAWPLAGALGIAGACGFVCCSESDRGRLKKGPPAAEDRFGNDTELLADFAALSRCNYDSHRLDVACDELVTLGTRLRAKRRRPDAHQRAITTLANLLESRRELTRLGAALHLYADRADPGIQDALREALKREQVESVKIAMLEQACYLGASWPQDLARQTVADQRSSARLRGEAANCLARADTGTRSNALGALDKALHGEANTAVVIRICNALRALRADASVDAIAARLAQPQTRPACAAALAAIGTDSASAALLDGLSKLSSPERPMDCQSIEALVAATARRSPAVRARARSLLTRVSTSGTQTEDARACAASALSALTAGEPSAGP